MENRIYCEECRRDRKLKEIRRRKEGMKATIPEGEHPFDYLFEGHQYLMAGCLLLEEVEVLEAEELEQIRKLLDPYAERIREFWLNIGEEK